MDNTVIVLSSCQYPADYFRYRTAYRSLDEIYKLFNQRRYRAYYRCVLIAGDIIYSDATAGVFDPVDPEERYTQKYKTLKLDSRLIETRYHKLIVSLDDHEIIDDWEPVALNHPDQELKRQYQDYRKDALKAFLDFSLKENTYFADKCNGLDIFVMDTRSGRKARTTQSVRTAKMFDDQQKNLLFNWISSIASNERNLSAVPPKFILSGSMLLPRNKETATLGESPVAGLRSDGWGGYPASLYEVLHHIVQCGLRNVVFLSGDAHIPCICFAEVTSSSGKSVEFVSIHGSALHAPLPFANGIKEDFMESEQFVLQPADDNQQETLSISYRTEFPDCGDGFAVLEMKQNKRARTVDTTVSFAGRDNQYGLDSSYCL